MNAINWLLAPLCPCNELICSLTFPKLWINLLDSAISNNVGHVKALYFSTLVNQGFIVIKQGPLSHQSKSVHINYLLSNYSA